jgi:PAS domain S-box-containing protein
VLRKNAVPLAAVVLTAGIFALDLQTPLGIADGILYLLPLLLTVWMPQRHSPFHLATVFTALILLGALLSPPGATLKTWGTNRAMSIVAVWVTAAFLEQRKRVEEGLCLAQVELERRVLERTADVQNAISILEKDITERKRAEQALRESEERFKMIMEHANDAIFYIDLNGKIHWASHQAEVLTGQPKDKFLGCTIMTLLAPESVAVAEARLDAVRRGEAVAPLVEIEFLRPDGMMIWGEANITSVQREGETIGRLLVVRDITERKVAEEAMRESDQQLRQLLEDRERISQNLHDNIIQTLYAIGLSLEESQRLIGADPKTAVNNLRNAVKDLNSVLRDVRSYSAWSEPKILSGQQLKAAIEQLARTIKGAHLLQFRLQVDIMAASQLTPEEASHVLYIVREAMSNSLRHSGAKTGVVMLQMRKGRVHLQVEDDGVGFAHAVNEGTGQGLGNIRARAQELGAKLEIVSEPGLGVRIALDIPKGSEHASA